MNYYVQSENGSRGETKSCARLIDDFWILNRSVDADGADIVIQCRHPSPDHMRMHREQVAAFGFVQAKFFQGTNQVRVDKKYIQNGDGAIRRDFFVFVHTLDRNDNPVDYFFSAADVANVWNVTKDDCNYYFALAAGRDYAEFRNLSRRELREKIECGVFDHVRHVLRKEVFRSVSLRASTRSPHHANSRYILCRPHGCPVVLYVSDDDAGHVVEARKDIFQSRGWFEWGYCGEGPKLLAASLFAHFFWGLRPTWDEIEALTVDLVGEFNRESAEILEDDIYIALAGLPYRCDVAKHPATQAMFQHTKAKYAELRSQLEHQRIPN